MHIIIDDDAVRLQWIYLKCSITQYLYIQLRIVHQEMNANECYREDLATHGIDEFLPKTKTTRKSIRSHLSRELATQGSRLGPI